ncbi:viperin family antiviral radical SAM protein [Ferrimonas sp. SCSIO 43195]|uniref:viperin family antiviral radical SAM protein n=1 Tax=Ferrimonas sp. SCSIO 43195 TaxID=2822844 RepID=UPI00207644B7|nr:viperin family antiviral radical SAM protein [Ferrimonas sp. SCSIO 43195]USD37977.1 viperin family antiviral radical SAM protein [Ferrimonas sp. SCSIO 43195]
MTSVNEMVINFHMTETCNYRCEYCYATWEGNDSQAELHHSFGDIQSLLRKLSNYFFTSNALKTALGYRAVRINFAGGEPVMLGGRFVKAVLLAKSLGFRTSIITNGHLLSTTMMRRIGPHLDMLGLSLDTSDALLAQSIGRVDRKGAWLSPENACDIVSAYRQANSSGTVKINTVVNAFNWREDMSSMVVQLQPERWKLLRVLPVYTHQLTVTSSQYRAYVERHAAFSDIVTIEDNQDMWQSYLMLNPQGCFYQNSAACQGVVQSPPVLEVGVEAALESIDFNAQAFAKRYPHAHSDASQA